MAENLLFYYLGDDEAYYKALQGEFRKHTRLIIDFKRIYETTESRIQSLFLKVYENKPACIFIDFSKQTQDYLHLARIVTRTPMEHSMITIGVVDYLSPPEIIHESIATGVTLTHIKSAETFDVIFDVVKHIAPSEIGEHGFATAQAKEEWVAGFPCKVGYVYGSGIHIETNHELTKGSVVKVGHFWTQKRMVPSKQFFVKETSNKNIFYNFKHSADLDFLFIDEFVPTEGMDVDTIKERQKDREEQIIFHKKQLQKWITDNESRSQEKKSKILVVDQEFHFLQNQPRTDKHPYLVRCIPFFDNIEAHLDRLQPQVIAFSLETTGKNTEDQLRNLVNILNTKYQELHPFIVVFKTKTPSKELQMSLSYPQTMASAGDLSVEAIMQMAALVEKKLGHSGQSKTDKVFLKKNNEATIAEILIPITVTKISETDISFSSTVQIPIGTNLHITSPVPMYINVQPAKTQGKTPEFYGLIHCLGEAQKKDLRRFINSVFFRDHDAQVNAETDEFKKLNEAKLHERLEAEKKAAEEKAKQDKDDEEKEKEEKKEEKSDTTKQS